ncbi:MAG: hypothetical protein ACP5E4_00035, partial [Candidatus Aenigmatarchaeota archaeon]
LNAVSKLSDERRQVVAVSYILRQFLEVKFGISKTLTYSEMVVELGSRDIDMYVKTHLIELFTKLPETIYRGAPLSITSESCFDLARKTLQKLGDKKAVPKLEIKAPK